MKKHKFEDAPDDLPNEYFYLLGKADLYLKMGPEIYCKSDYFQMPPGAMMISGV